jgi:hypothetical protein
MKTKNPLGSASRSEREILEDPIGEDGLFEVPKSFGPHDEVRWRSRRMDSIRLAQYSDSKCGFPPLVDKAYLCGGRKDKSTPPCNKFITQTHECLIRIDLIDKPHNQSCMYWETQNAGDSEGRYCPHSKEKMTDQRISFGSTDDPLGFGCIRCEYGQGKLPYADSEGRESWCSLKGHPVEAEEDKTGCCAEQEPIEVDEDKEEDEDDD